MRDKLMAFLYIVITLSVLGWGITLLLEGKDTRIKGVKLSKAIEEQLPKDSVSIVHFFSSWCVYCRVEFPYIIELKAQSKLPIIGIAYKDTQEQIVPWLDHMGNPFKEVIYDESAKLAYQMGVTSIPQTFVVNQKGKIIYTQNEAMNQASYKKLIDFLEGLDGQD